MLLIVISLSALAVGFGGAQVWLRKNPKWYHIVLRCLTTGCALLIFAEVFYALGGNKDSLALPVELSQYLLSLMVVGGGIRSVLVATKEKGFNRFLAPGIEEMGQ